MSDALHTFLKGGQGSAKFDFIKYPVKERSRRQRETSSQRQSPQTTSNKREKSSISCTGRSDSGRGRDSDEGRTSSGRYSTDLPNMSSRSSSGRQRANRIQPTSHVSHDSGFENAHQEGSGSVISPLDNDLSSLSSSSGYTVNTRQLRALGKNMAIGAHMRKVSSSRPPPRTLNPDLDETVISSIRASFSFEDDELEITVRDDPPTPYPRDSRHTEENVNRSGGAYDRVESRTKTRDDTPESTELPRRFDKSINTSEHVHSDGKRMNQTVISQNEELRSLQEENRSLRRQLDDSNRSVVFFQDEWINSNKKQNTKLDNEWRKLAREKENWHSRKTKEEAQLDEQRDAINQEMEKLKEYRMEIETHNRRQQEIEKQQINDKRSLVDTLGTQLGELRKKIKKQEEMIGNQKKENEDGKIARALLTKRVESLERQMAKQCASYDVEVRKLKAKVQTMGNRNADLLRLQYSSSSSLNRSHSSTSTHSTDSRSHAVVQNQEAQTNHSGWMRTDGRNHTSDYGSRAQATPEIQPRACPSPMNTLRPASPISPVSVRRAPTITFLVGERR